MKANNSALLTRRVKEIIDRKSLEGKLVSGRKLRVKLGVDPTGADLHLGHAVPLRKLREFQEAGHTAVFIIGDWTAMIGDPSGKDKTRGALTRQQIEKNLKYFKKQAGKILDLDKAEVHLQSEWFEKFGMRQIIELASKVSVGELLQHETFRKRLDRGFPLSFHEMLYPLLQGFDSVMVKADVEMGAMEQKFNILMGRTIQRAYNQPAQDVMLLPYLIGLDGNEKMSKSLNNYVALHDTPEEMFGKLMSIPDGLILQYFELCTDIPQDELDAIAATLKKGLENPRTIKIRMANDIVTLYHGSDAAKAALQDFEKKFGKNKDLKTAKPDVVVRAKTLEIKAGIIEPTVNAEKKISLIYALVEGKLALSKSEARRKIKERAVEVDGEKITDENALIDLHKVSFIRLGKRFLKIV